jgi:hypothetical protein
MTAPKVIVVRTLSTVLGLALLVFLLPMLLLAILAVVGLVIVFKVLGAFGLLKNRSTRMGNMQQGQAGGFHFTRVVTFGGPQQTERAPAVAEAEIIESSTSDVLPLEADSRSMSVDDGSLVIIRPTRVDHAVGENVRRED